MPGADGQRRDRGLHRLSRAVQHHARPGERRHPLPPGRDARRGDGAGRVDDLEMRGRAHSVRRRQGRRHLRPDAHVAPRARGADPPLRRRDHRPDRPGEGRPGARRQHQRPGHGVGDGHLQHARRPHRDGGRHRQAARDGRLARPARGDRPRRDDRDARSGEAPRLRHQGRDGRASRGSATSDRSPRELLAEHRREDRRRSPTGRAASTTRRASISPKLSTTSGSTRPSPASPAASRSPTSSCSSSTSTC